MLQHVENKDPGWKEWLIKYQIFDCQSSEDEMYIRYQKFKDVTFPLVPERYWSVYFQDLVSIEQGLVYGDAIGCCTVLPFNFKMNKSEPVKSKPIMYSQKERNWINQYVEKQIELGIMKEVVRGRDEEPIFLSNVVLVKEGQSQQAYRFCGNFIPLNQQMETPSHPMTDCKATLDRLFGYKCYSAIDIKAGFLNIVVLDELKLYLGIITQDGIYIYERMPFGTTASACHFQAVMNYILNKEPLIQHSTYLDDCTIGAETPEENWSHTMEAMVRLINAGLPINIKKCQFLRPDIKLLGYLFSDSQYQLGNKSITKLFGGTLPKTRQRLQSLLGQLNFASNFIPQYRKRIQPIISLLSKDSDGCWKQQHTDILNMMAEDIMKRCKLSLVNTCEPLTIYVDEAEGYIDSIITQGEEQNLVICDFAHRKLTVTEAVLPRIERLMVSALWVIKRLSRYTYYVPKLIISFPQEAEMHVAQSGTTLSPRMQAKLIELSSFQCEFTHSYSAVDLLQQIGQLFFELPQGVDQIDKKVWIHEDIIIPTLQKSQDTMDIRECESYLLQFDGGCSQQLGTGGSVLWDESRKLISGRYFYYGPQRPTNNKAEAQSLLDALTFTLQQPWPQHINALIVEGDSSLIIQFMLGFNKPGDSKLVEIIRKCFTLQKQYSHIKIRFLHIPREKNKWADRLCRIAFDRKGDGIINNISLNICDDFKEVSHQLLVTFDNSATTQQSNWCQVCKQFTEELQCWGCSSYFHKHCLQAKYIPIRRGPWHCKSCRLWFRLMNTRDITLDEQVLNYLSHSELSASQATTSRILKTSSYISMDYKGKLWCTGIKEGPPRRIPPISQRKEILQSSLGAMNNPNGETLFQLLQPHYYWTGMRTDCLAVASSLLCRQKAKAKFPIPPYIRPPNKGSYPFSIWAIDCIVNLSPPSPTGSTTVVVCIDPFTKWVELGDIPQLNSYQTSVWFHNNIICRYGVPIIIRSDRGSEFKGQFHKYLELMGVEHRYITTMNPRSNGQAERTVRSVKEGITRCLAECHGAMWWEVLGEVARGLRLAISKATQHSPYHLVFKQQPLIPFLNAIATPNSDLDNLTSDDIEVVIKEWENQFKVVVINQLKYDKKMVQDYYKRRSTSNVDIRYIFEPGDPVLLRNKEPGKLKCKAIGPYIFIKYKPPDGMVAEVKNMKGKEYTVSSLNLLPIRNDGNLRMLRYSPYNQNSPIQQEQQSSDISISQSESDSKLPQGVRIQPEWGLELEQQQQLNAFSRQGSLAN